MKKMFLLVGAVALVALFASCASTPAGGMFGGPGPAFSEVNGNSVKTGEASSVVVLGVFGKVSYPPAWQVAKDNGITKIATVEYYKQPGVLGFTTKYFTYVTGE
ncbi:hypothetical protein AGMMS49940_07910 [Spirochaetia bacterium]|nr:hypothetical protein AGMMS49940_07910 [Spirochaetia bacterium]